MRALYALVASLGLVLLAAPVSASALESDASDCAGAVCDAINRVCQRVGGANCLGEAALADAHCMGEVCDVINFVCYTAVRAYCVG